VQVGIESLHDESLRGGLAVGVTVLFGVEQQRGMGWKRDNHCGPPQRLFVRPGGLENGHFVLIECGPISLRYLIYRHDGRVA